MSDEKEFVNGLIVKPPHTNAPDFVKCSISIKRADLGNWLRGKDDEWINIDVKESKSGKWYAEVSNWKPNKDVDGYPKNSQQKNPTYGKDDFQAPANDFVDSEDIPFN